MDSKIKQLEEIMKLMQKYQVDHVELDGVKVNKTLHLGPEEDSARPVTDEELLFYSSDV